MMTQAFYSGISGLKSNSIGIDAVSDNLANINTVGYRGYEVEFSSIYEKSIASTGNIFNSSIGIGTQVNGSTTMLETGSLLLSDKSTDLAVDGDGWFGVQGEDSAVYTRNGNFTFDENNDLVSADGYYVLGTMGGNIGEGDVLTSKLNEIDLGEVASQEKLRFPKTLTYPPEATKNTSFIGNVGVGLEPVVMGASVIDSQNNKNHLKLKFTKDATQNPPGSQWTVVATTKSLDGETLYDTQTGSVAFDSSGSLISSTLTTIDNNGTAVSIDLGSGYEGIVSIDLPLSPGSSVSDGTIGGDLQGYAINKNAEVIATFTNGEQSSVGKIALFHFQNDQGLERLSGSQFQKTSNSGEPIFFKDATGQNIIGATVANFKLETSNYDMATGLTQLIILQRAYDANSKSVSTADQMMQKALSMDA